KCHPADGRVYVLTDWRVDAAAEVVRGPGLLYSPERALVRRGGMTVELSKGGLFETNRPRGGVGGARMLGPGLLYSPERALVRRGDMTVELSKVVLFETNRPREVVDVARIVVMAVVT